MDSLAAGRAQMGLSLGFHIVFAACGIGMPVLMLMAEGLWLRTGKPHYRQLAQTWAKATGLLFAIGAVSGTALSFELGLLWPRFMELAGGTVGPAFALEAFAFFIEAIFLGLYLYGWEKLSPLAHWLCGIPVALSGLLSGILVVAVNAWMQVPGGDAVSGPGLGDPWATFRSPAWGHMALHSSLACYIAVGFGVAGVYASGIFRGRNDAYHRSGLSLALLMGTVTALLQPLSGDFNGRIVAKYQPAKLAAMEALFESRTEAPLLIGGIPDAKTGTVRYGIEIPAALSLLVAHDPHAKITGLNDFPPEERPDVLAVHLAFQVMVGSGLILIALGLWYWGARWRSKQAPGKWLLRGIIAGSPLGFVALQAGWLVTELGRQPWAIYGVLRTSEAGTPVADVPGSLFLFSAVYVGLAVTLVVLLVRLAKGRTAGDQHGA